jgi:hypothetical protein
MDIICVRLIIFKLFTIQYYMVWYSGDLIIDK